MYGYISILLLFLFKFKSVSPLLQLQTPISYNGGNFDFGQLYYLIDNGLDAYYRIIVRLWKRGFAGQ